MMMGFYLDLMIAFGIYLVAFPVLFLCARTIVKKKYGSQKQWISVVIPLFLSVSLACVLFCLWEAPKTPEYYQPHWRPAASTIIGTWDLTSGTLESLRTEKYPEAAHTLELRENGEFSITNTPDLVFYLTRGRLCNGEGTWKLEKGSYGQWQVRLIFSKLDPACASGLSGLLDNENHKKPVEIKFEIWNSKPPFILSVMVAEDMAIIYQKSGEIYDHKAK